MWAAKGKKGQYPCLEPLEVMRYTTPLVSGINEKEANLIAKTYIDCAQVFEVNEICMTPFMATSGSRDMEIKSSRIATKIEDDIISPYGGPSIDIVHTVETSFRGHSDDLYGLTQRVIEKLNSQIKNLARKSDTFGSIAFSRRLLIQYGYMDTWGWISIEEMDKKLCQLSAQMDPLTLTFTSLNLKYIEDNVVKFNMPFDLMTNVLQ